MYQPVVVEEKSSTVKTLLKWVLYLAILVGVVFGIYKLLQWYKDRKAKKQQSSSSASSSSSSSSSSSASSSIDNAPIESVENSTATTPVANPPSEQGTSSEESPSMRDDAVGNGYVEQTPNCIDPSVSSDPLYSNFCGSQTNDGNTLGGNGGLASQTVDSGSSSSSSTVIDVPNAPTIVPQGQITVNDPILNPDTTNPAPNTVDSYLNVTNPSTDPAVPPAQAEPSFQLMTGLAPSYTTTRFATYNANQKLNTEKTAKSSNGRKTYISKLSSFSNIPSTEQCIKSCRNDSQCLSYEYDSSTKKCNIYKEAGKAGDESSSRGWGYVTDETADKTLTSAYSNALLQPPNPFALKVAAKTNQECIDLAYIVKDVRGFYFDSANQVCQLSKDNYDSSQIKYSAAAGDLAGGFGIQDKSTQTSIKQVGYGEVIN